MSAWIYNAYVAMLLRDGRKFAIVTPDGKNALSKVDERLLLDALNHHSNAAPVAEVAGQEDLKLT